MRICCCRRDPNSFLRPTQGRVLSFSYCHKRLFASALTSKAWKHHSVELPVGLSGHVKLDFVSPDRRTAEEHGPRNLLVHFPPGPSIGTNGIPPIDVLPQLQNSFTPSTSLVTINYRLGNNIDSAFSPREVACFPVPIHDVSTAFDYLTSPTSPFNADYEEAPKICLLGRNIGGALATMLALTESNEIHALAVIEPMVDWAGLDDIVEQLRAVDTSSPVSRKRQKQKVTNRYDVENQSVVAAVEELIKLRAKLFKTPSAYFDPFASPMLFLRAPGKDTPSATTVADQSVDGTSLDQLESHGDYDSLGPVDDDSWQSSSSRPTSSSSSSHDTIEALSDGNIVGPNFMSRTQPRRRKVLRRWPGVGLPESVTLPYVKIFVQSQTGRDAHPLSSEAEDLARGHAALMRAQGLEMVELMRRACFLGREKGFAEERVRVHEQEQDQRTMDGPEQESEHRSLKGTAQPQGGVPRTRAKMQESAIEWAASMFARE